MATANSTRARGIKIENHSWGLFARGTRETLIQHGITQDGSFPGDPGEKKTTCNTIDTLGRAITINRASKTTFSVFRHWSEEEKIWHDRREAQKAEAERAARRREEEMRSATRLVDSWPKTDDDFRETARKWAECSLGIFESLLLNEVNGGYRYDDDTTLRIGRMVDQLMELVDTGTIVKDMALREKHTPACIAETVRAADAAIQNKGSEQAAKYRVNGNVVYLSKC